MDAVLLNLDFEALQEPRGFLLAHLCVRHGRNSKMLDALKFRLEDLEAAYQTHIMVCRFPGPALAMQTNADQDCARAKGPRSDRAAPDRAACWRIVKGQAWQPDAIKPALEDGRYAVPPGRNAQHERVCRLEPFNIACDTDGVPFGVVVHLALFEGEHRPKLLGIEV